MIISGTINKSSHILGHSFDPQSSHLSNDLALLRFFGNFCWICQVSWWIRETHGEVVERTDGSTWGGGLQNRVRLGVLGCFIQICWDLHENYRFLTSWKPTQLWQKIGFQQIHPKTSLYRKLHPYQATTVVLGWKGNNCIKQFFELCRWFSSSTKFIWCRGEDSEIHFFGGFTFLPWHVRNGSEVRDIWKISGNVGLLDSV